MTAIPARTYGLQPSGWVAPTFEAIRERNVARLKAALRKRGRSDDIRTDPESNFGRQIDAATAYHLEAWEEFGRSIEQLSSDGATGIFLDNIAYMRARLIRLPKRKTTLTYTFTSVAGQEIPAGAQIRLDADEDVVFIVDAAGTVATGETLVEVTATASEYGPISVDDSESGWTIVNTFPGYETVTSIVASSITPGRLTETDDELRARMLSADINSGLGVAGAIRRKILEDAMNEGDQVFVTSNRTDTTDGEGRPPNATEIVVWSADTYADEAIAQAIFESIGSGDSMVGDYSAVITDQFGRTDTVRWNRATDVRIFVDVADVVLSDDAPDDWAAQMQAVTVSYVNGLQVGALVRRFVVERIATCFTWVLDATVTIKKDGGSFSTANIVIGAREKAVVTSAADVTTATA